MTSSTPKDFGFGSDEQMFRDSVRRVLAERAPVEHVRRLVGDPTEVPDAEPPPARFDVDLWDAMVELGWTSIAVPEEAGGAGMKCVAVAALAEEIGRRALPGPLPATLFATMVLRQAETDVALAWLREIAAGRRATLAVQDQEGSLEPERCDVRARREGVDAILDGKAAFVQDAQKADFFVVAARDPNGVGLYAVSPDADGIEIVPDGILDLTRDQATVSFSGARVPAAGVLVEPRRGAEVLSRAIPSILTLIAADVVGAAEWQLQTTAEYAKVRRQFDRPIGFFQAVKHPIVDMMLSIDRTRSLVYAAACALDVGAEDAERLARLAKASASDTAGFCSSRSVQLHGGIGFTWECDVQIYFKRQKHSQALFGGAAWHREKVAEIL